MNLQQYLNIMISLFVLPIMISLIAVIYMIHHHTIDAAMIGIAARQPMLVIKLENEIQTLKHTLENKPASQQHQKLKQLITLFDTSLNALKNGGSAQNTGGATIQLPPSQGAAKHQLAQVQTQWQQIQSTLTLILTLQPAQNSKKIYQAIKSLNNSWQQLLTESTTAVVLLEQASMQKIIFLKQMIIGIVIFILMSALFSRWFNSKYLLTPFNTLLNFTQSVESTAQLPKLTPFRQLAHHIDAMHQKFHVICQQMQTRHHELLTIHQALNNVTTRVLIVDTQEKIIYLNESAQQFFQEHQLAIHQQGHDFDANQLMGHSFSFFHQLLIPAPKINATDKPIVQSHLNMGDRYLTTQIIPVLNQQNEQLGWIIEFQDRSIEIAIEQEINTVINTALQGDFKQRIQLDNKKEGFLKNVAQMLNQVLDLNQQFIETMIQIFAMMAKGDLTQMITQQYPGTLAQLKIDINTTINQLTKILNIVKQTAETLTETAKQFSQDSFDLSQRTEQQAAALQQTAASMEQMTSTIQKNAEHASQATRLATHASQLAGQGGQKISEVVTAMTAIEQSSQQISDITSIIDEIAFQTNLLALNAAVEAARAGEQGRGFAVVATEVRHLAQRSAEYSNKISQLIKKSCEQITQGTSLVNQTANMLEEIITAAREASYVIVEMAASSQEQAAGIEQVNKALIQIDNTTQKNANLAYQVASMSEAMNKQAQDLQQNMNFFKTIDQSNSP